MLEILSAATEDATDVRGLIRAVALLGVSAGSLRVALARLKADGLVSSPRRGAYALGPAARAVHAEVANWRDVAERVRRWTGGWVGVSTAGLARADRAALRKRQRALRLLGFRQLAVGLSVRPDNLEGGVTALRRRLHELGVDPSAPVFAMDQLDDDTECAALALWDVAALHKTYRQMRNKLDRSVTRLDAMSPEAAAREAFLLGGEAIRHIVLDPLLPAAIVDTDARAALSQAMREYDRRGRALWRRVLSGSGPGAEAAAHA